MLDWFVKKDSFKPLEISVLLLVAQKLVPEARALFQKQIAAVNKIQRHANGKEVCLYRMANGRPTFQPEIQFPTKREETMLAKVSFQYANGKQSNTADILLVNGFLFSLLFRTTPEPIKKTSEIQNVDTEIFLDPLLDLNKTESVGKGQIPLSLKGKYKVECLDLPLSDNQVLTLQKQNPEVEFPKEYLEIMKFTNGCTLDGSTLIFAMDKIRHIAFENTNYTALAEKEGQGIIVVENADKSGTLFLLPFDGSNRHNMGKSFFVAIEELFRLRAAH